MTQQVQKEFNHGKAIKTHQKVTAPRLIENA